MRVMFLEPRNNLEIYLPKLKDTIEHLIKDYGATTFFFSEVSRFTYQALGIIEKLRRDYPFCELCLIVSDESDSPPENERKTYPKYIYLSALSVFGKRDAAFARNIWMIDNCDIVVLYPEQDQMADLSFRKYVYEKGKTVVIAD